MIEGAHEQLVAPLSITLQSSPGMLPFSQALEHIKISLMSLGWHKGTDLNRCRIAQQSNSRDKMVKTQRTSLTLSWKRKKKCGAFLKGFISQFPILLSYTSISGEKKLAR